MRIAVIGAGFGGLSTAAHLAKAGHEVHVFEKNDIPGGRAAVVKKDGFTFDLGPSWYLMPDVFEEFFAHFDHKPSDFYELKELSPSYKVFTENNPLTVRPAPAALNDFEALEPGASQKLSNHLRRTNFEYEEVRKNILTVDGLSVRQFLRPAILRSLRPSMLGSFHSRVKRVVKHKDLQKVLEFMVVFLGGSPRNIPALYGLLNWVDLGQGVWYPKGGFGEVVRAFETVAKEQGAKFHYKREVTGLAKHEDGVEVTIDGKKLVFDRVVVNADYQYAETQLLKAEDQSYKQSYWQKKTLSPSAVIGLVGVKGRVTLPHHGLFFDTEWEKGFAAVFKSKSIHKKPLFYVCTPSVTDPTVAPSGCENLYILIPVSNKAEISDADGASLVDNALQRIVEKTQQPLPPLITKAVLGPRYFTSRFNASAGNAFGLAHTLKQTGPLRPKIRSSKVPGLYFVGQFTNPGTGVPLVVLSGKVVANRLLKDLND